MSPDGSASFDDDARDGPAEDGGQYDSGGQRGDNTRTLINPDEHDPNYQREDRDDGDKPRPVQGLSPHVANDDRGTGERPVPQCAETSPDAPLILFGMLRPNQ